MPAGYFVGDAAVQRSAIVHSICQFGIDIARQVFEHFFTVEYILGKVFTGPLGRCFYCCCFLLESCFNYSENLNFDIIPKFV